MKSMFRLLILMGLCSNLFAQGDITGSVIDKNHLPFEFATIALYQSENLITGVITDEQGKFILKDIPYGTYKILVSYLGFNEVVIENINLINAVQVIEPIVLNEKAEKLNEVVITEQREFIQKRLDKKVILVSKNLNASGGSLDNVLLADPSFSTNSLGEISFRGSQNFKVLIDGRPTLNNGSEALQSIPIATIARVEVVTNPSAKYQADSEVGIINVILKKGYDDGVSGQVGIRFDYRDKGNSLLETNANLQAKWNKVRIYFQALATSDTIQLEGPTTIDIENISEGSFFHRDRIGNQLLISNNLNIQTGVDIELTKRNSLGVWTTLYRSNSNYNALTKDIDRLNENPVVFGRLDYKNDRKANATQVTIEDTYKINNQKELHFLTDYSVTSTRRNNFRDYFTANQDNPISETHLEKAVFYQDEDRNRWHTELNYSNSMSDTTRLEIGVLLEYYNRTNTFEEFNFDAHVRDDEADFDFTVYNAYINYSSIWKDINISVGSRFEQSNRKLRGVESNSLTDFFPSITLGKNFKNDFILTINYSKRIRRPSARDLSPILLYSDNQVTWRGNPTLTDAKVHALSLSVQKKFEKFTFNTELFYRLADGGWFRVLEYVGDNRFENYPITIEYEKNTGLEFTSSWNASPKLNLSVNGAVFKQYINNNQPLEDLSTNSSRIVFTTNFKASKNLKIQFDANYNGPAIYANSKIAETHFFNLSIQKKVPKTGLTLSLFANDFSGGNIYKQSYDNAMNGSENTRLVVESYPSNTKYFGFHLKYDFRNYKRKDIDRDIQFND